MMSKYIVLMTLGLFCIRCASTSSDSGPTLDISMDRKAAFDEKSAPPSSPSIQLGAQENIDWQKFFKPTPSESQREQLQKKLLPPEQVKEFPALITQARNHLVLGQMMAAETAFRQALRMKPESPELLIELAELQLRRHDTADVFEYLAQAKQELESMAHKDATLSFRYRYVYALALLQTGDYKSAHSILSDLIALDRTFTPGYSALAASYLSRGTTDLAEFVAKRGIDRAKEMPTLFNILGQVAKQRNDDALARSYFNRALALDPLHVPTLVNLAGLLFEQGDHEAAELNLRKAQQHAPGDMSTYLALGAVQRRMGQSTEAKLSLGKAIELNPENAEARFQLAILMHQEFKETNEALRLLHEVAQLQDKKLSPLAELYIDDIRSQAVVNY